MNGHLGIVVLHLVTRVLDLPLDIPIITPIFILLAHGLIAKLPNLNPSEVFTPEAMQHLDVFRTRKGCITLLFQLSSGVSILKAGRHENETMHRYQQSAASGRKAFKASFLSIKVEKTLSPHTIRQLEPQTMPQRSHRLLPGVASPRRCMLICICT